MKSNSSKTLAFAASASLILLALLLWRQEQAIPIGDNDLPTAESTLEATVSNTSAEIIELGLRSDPQSSGELLALARQRSSAMRELMKSDPLSALEHAFSHADYQQLPTDVQELVERPFSEAVNYRVLAICYDESQHSHQIHSIQFGEGERIPISKTPYSRLPVSKNGIPLQGIELGDIAVVRPGVFERVQNEDLQWAQQNLPLANPDPAKDFADGLEIGDSPTWAISGGYLFTFASTASLEQFETRLALLDAKPGLQIGSSALLAKLESADGQDLSVDEFLTIQSDSALPPPEETRDYLIIRVDFSDKTEVPYTKQEIESLVNNRVAPALANFSYNKTTVAVSATETVFRIGASTDYLDTVNNTVNANAIHADAITAYTGAGNANPIGTYDVVSVLFPKLEVGWAGLADVGGPDQWLNGSVDADTVLHELGHNYGLSHASYWQHNSANPNSTNPVDPTGDGDGLDSGSGDTFDNEYGDIYDVMGDGTVDKGHFHAGAKNYLGWLSSNDVTLAETASDNGIHKIYAFDTVSATGKQAIKVKKGANSEYYWVGYRTAYPGIANFDKGAYLVWQRPGSFNNRTWLVDTTPGSADGKADAGLSLGRTYSDPDAKVHITPLATGQDSNGRYLEVAVNIGDFPGNQAPTGTLTASTQGEARTGVPFSFSGSDPDGDALSYHWDFGDGTVEQNAASVDHEFPVGGSYTLTLTVSDQKGGTSVHQASIEVSDPITQTTVRQSGTNRNLTALAANDTVVVIGGAGGTYLRSTDGETWTSHTLGGFRGNHTTNQIIWTGGSFIAVGSDWDGSKWVGIAFSSEDGTSWTEEVRTTETVGQWGFISIAEDPTSNTSVVVQSDGKLLRRDPEGNFTVVDLGLQNDGWKNEASVVWTGSHFVLGAYDFSQPNFDDRLTIYRSEDGAAWTRVASADSGLLGWYGLSELDFLNNSLLGSGFAAGIVYSTNNGESWTNNSGNTENRVNLFAYGNGIYSAHGTVDIKPDTGNGSEDIDQDFLSTDGRNWQAAGDPGNSFNDRIFFANTFISVGDSGLIVQSQEFLPPIQSPFEAWIVGFISSESDQSALANPDFDWAPNFMEFALGSDPIDGASVPSPPSLELLTDGRISVTIHRLAKTDVGLSLEQSTNLTDWSPLPATTSKDSDILLELITTDTFDTSDSIFIRIKASQ